MKLLIFFLILSNHSYGAQEVRKKFEEYTVKVQEKLEELSGLKAEDFYSRVDSFRSTIDEYIEQKKHVCTGDFSLIVLEGEENPKRPKRVKLSKEEKSLCLAELKALQVFYINNMFTARKRYLDYLHEKRIKQLSSLREEALRSLRAGFRRKRK